MNSLSFPALLVLSFPALAQTPAYVQPMAPNGGTLRPSQMWIDPTGQNDLDSDAQAWEDFQLPQATTITRVRWWGEAAPALGFAIEFWNQDPNTIAVQPDLFSGPFSEAIYTSFTQTSVGGNLYQFEAQLAAPVTVAANTRYFISVVGQQPIAFAYWNWASSPSGTNGTFWWQRGLHMYFHLGDNRAVALASSAGWPTGTTFCFGDGTSGACPCANPAAGTGRGCDNSSLTGGATLVAAGSASLAADSVTLFSANQRPTGTSIVLQGSASTPGASAFGQGLRCVGGALKRLYVKTAANGAIAAPQSGDAHVAARSGALGDPITATEHRYYMVYYRDPAVLGGCAPELTYNATNAVDLYWAP